MRTLISFNVNGENAADASQYIEKWLAEDGVSIMIGFEDEEKNTLKLIDSLMFRGHSDLNVIAYAPLHVIDCRERWMLIEGKTYIGLRLVSKDEQESCKRDLLRAYGI